MRPSFQMERFAELMRPLGVRPEAVQPVKLRKQQFKDAGWHYKFLNGYNSTHFQNLVQAKPLYAFEVLTMAAIGLAFEMPLFLLGLRAAGLINGRTLEQHFPRDTLQRNIRQPLETVGYQEKMDVVARLHGGGISAQAGALRHGVSRALLEADPNLRGELKRRGFLTRDPRVKERKKAGLKKARKRPQFSKR